MTMMFNVEVDNPPRVKESWWKRIARLITRKPSPFVRHTLHGRVEELSEKVENLETDLAEAVKLLHEHGKTVSEVAMCYEYGRVVIRTEEKDARFDNLKHPPQRPKH